MRGRGFTLLEMLLATVLTAVLMVGVMSVIAHLGQPLDGTADARGLSTAPDDAWIRLLRDDLSCATTADASRPNQLTLSGFVGVDPATGERTHRPAEVRYLVAEVDGEPWLLREQLALDTEVPRMAQRGLVGRGATRIELVKLSAGAEPESETDEQPAEAARPHADRWRLRVWADDPATPAIDQVLALNLARETPDE